MMEVRGVLISWAKLAVKSFSLRAASVSWAICSSSRSAMALKSSNSSPSSSSLVTGTRRDSSPAAMIRATADRRSRGRRMARARMNESTAAPAMRASITPVKLRYSPARWANRGDTYRQFSR